MGSPSLQSGHFNEGAPGRPVAPPRRTGTQQDRNVPVSGREEGGLNTGVSRPPTERRSGPLSGDETRGACHGPWPT
nr:MAG TPA: hypothetical protein [Caudoviricetes sp.]